MIANGSKHTALRGRAEWVSAAWRSASVSARAGRGRGAGVGRGRRRRYTVARLTPSAAHAACMPTAGARSVTALSSRSRRCRPSSGDPQDLGDLFLHLDNRLRLLQAALQARLLALELGHPPRQRRARGGGAPALLGAQGGSVPCSRCRRQVVRWDEYRPSRRRSPPRSPAPAQASASCRTHSLYSAANRRRAARSATSGSGGGGHDAQGGRAAAHVRWTRGIRHLRAGMGRPLGTSRLLPGCHG